jgi:hypothetical protein
MDLPTPAGNIADVYRTALAHILINRDGPALQPGPRRYARSWIRDGATMCAALLRAGFFTEVRDFLLWYAPWQREDGYVPCCVDRLGVDDLVEHDSHGQWLYCVVEYYRFSGDLALVEQLQTTLWRQLIICWRCGYLRLSMACCHLPSVTKAIWRSPFTPTGMIAGHYVDCAILPGCVVC